MRTNTIVSNFTKFAMSKHQKAHFLKNRIFPEKSHRAEKPKTDPLNLQNVFFKPKTFQKVNGIAFDQMKSFFKKKSLSSKT